MNLCQGGASVGVLMDALWVFWTELSVFWTGCGFFGPIYETALNILPLKSSKKLFFSRNIDLLLINFAQRTSHGFP